MSKLLLTLFYLITPSSLHNVMNEFLGPSSFLSIVFSFLLSLLSTTNCSQSMRELREKTEERTTIHSSQVQIIDQSMNYGLSLSDQIRTGTETDSTSS